MDPISANTQGDNSTIQGNASHVDWAAILLGTAVASAITIVLTGFGSAIGLSLVSPFEGKGVAGVGLAVATGLWVIWVMLSSIITGAYLTGRMRTASYDAEPDEVTLRDGSHGLVVWSLTVVIAALIAAGGISTLGKNSGDLANSAISSASDMAATNTDYTVDGLTRAEQIATVLTPEARAQISRIVLRAGTDGTLRPDDRTHLSRVLITNVGMSQAEANTRIENLLSRARLAIENVKLAAERARRTAILIAFLTAASLSVAAAAAWWAAALGGKHRDENTVISVFNS
jgi:hypothetical protein